MKLNKQGLVSKTWEAQLIRGGMSDGSGAFGVAPFDFTIEGDALAEEARAAMEANVEVKVIYTIEGVYSAFRSESGGTFVTKIERVQN